MGRCVHEIPRDRELDERGSDGSQALRWWRGVSPRLPQAAQRLWEGLRGDYTTENLPCFFGVYLGYIKG